MRKRGSAKKPFGFFKEDKYLGTVAARIVMIILFGIIVVYFFLYVLRATYSSGISLVSPSDNSLQNYSVVTFNATAYDSFVISNVSLFVNNILRATDYSGKNNTWYSFSYKLSDGNYSWYYKACDVSGSCFSSATRNFTLISEDGWNMFMHDSSHSGYYPWNVNLSRFTEIWNYSTSAPVYSSPSSYAGYVYIGSEDGNLYALNTTDGSLIWDYPTGGPVDTNSPVVENGEVYFGSSDTNVYVVNSTTGSLLGGYTPGGDPSFSSPTYYKGALYFGAEDDYLYCINAVNQSLLWTFNTGAGVESSPAVYDGIAYIGSYDNTLYALNATSGNSLWNFSASLGIFTSPVVENGMVYVGDYNNNTYALNAYTGAEMWNYSLANDNVSFLSLSISNGVAYLGTSSEVYALNATNGSFLWKTFIGTPTSSQVSSSKNGIAFFQSEGTLYALDSLTGTIVFEYNTSAGESLIGIDSSPSIYDGMVYLGGNDGNVYAFGQYLVPPHVNLISPANGSVLTNSSVSFSGTSFGGKGISNVSLYIDGVANQTNSSGINNTNYTFTASGLSDGNHSWFYYSCDPFGNCAKSETLYFNVYTVSPNISLVFPPQNYKDNKVKVSFEGIVSDRINVSNVSFYLNGVREGINSSGMNDTEYVFSENLTNGNYSWSYGACNSLGLCDSSSLMNLSVDTILPSINFSYPTLDSGYYEFNYIPVNISVSDNDLKNFTVNLYNSSKLIRTGTSYSASFSFWNFTGLPYGIYYLNATATDTFGNSNSTGTRVIGLYSLGINDTISPYAVINSSSVSLKATSWTSSSIWANVTRPDGSSSIVPLENNKTYVYNDTSEIGRYNVTFYANDSSGKVVSVSDYFNSFIPYSFSFSVLDSQGGGVSSSSDFYYRGSNLSYDVSSTGDYNLVLPDTSLNVEAIAYGGDINVILRGINLSNGNGKSIGLENLGQGAGYLVLYGIESPSDFSNATVYLGYNNTYYSNESSLHLYKCDPYDFQTNSCQGTWKDITADSILNTTTHSFEYNATSFSGFIITQGNYSESSSSASVQFSHCTYDLSFNWACSNWSSCVDSIQNRICKSVNNCGNNYGRPVTQRSCIPVVKLFDIGFRLENLHIINSSDLAAAVFFQNFGDIPTLVNLTYIIYNSEGQMVYSEKDNITLHTKDTILKTFNSLNLSNGEYSLILNTVYGNNVTESFRQSFTVGNVSLADETLGWVLDNYRLEIIPLEVILIVLIFIIVLRSINNKPRRKSSRR